MILRRFLRFAATVAVLTALMYAAWGLTALLLPEGIFRSLFTRLFGARVGEFTFARVFLANLILPFLGTQFMNLFRVGKVPGGLYVLPVFWLLYGVLLGTNSFVFAGARVPVSLSVLWTRTGFTELLAYTAGYEASRNWALWQQHGLTRVSRIEGKEWKPSLGDWAYWAGGLGLLIIAVAREVQI
ncbi:MAG: hypothetical protein M8467_03065 [Anaerolineae bacterium]|nr:hypothetical protein [Anaerolineae bacterium]